MDERKDETGFRSRKFVAYLVAEVTWKALAALVLFWGKDSIEEQVWAIMLVIILVAGFVEVGYIIGQASLDKYIRLAKIAADAGQEITLGNVTARKKSEPVKKPPTDPDAAG